MTEIDIPRIPFDVRRYMNPAGFDTDNSRVLLHEASHYWQQLSQYYPFIVADEDWERLRQFRRSGRVSEPGVLNVLWRKPHAIAGVSPRDLMECNSRYWDILNIGPHNFVESELKSGVELDKAVLDRYQWAVKNGVFRTADDGFSFVTVDLAMRVAGAYARPYIRLQDRIGDPNLAMTLFPLLAHWSLQTPAPITLFDVFADHAVSFIRRQNKVTSWIYRLTRGRRRVSLGELDSHQKTLYWLLGRSMYEIAVAEGFRLWTVGQFINFTGLGTHPIYSWATRWVREMGKSAIREGAAADMDRLRKRDPEAHVLLAADRILALPGGPINRELLWRHLCPPIHRFSDDLTWFTAVEPNHADNVAVAEHCMEIHTWWEDFRKARRGY